MSFLNFRKSIANLWRSSRTSEYLIPSFLLIFHIQLVLHRERKTSLPHSYNREQFEIPPVSSVRRVPRIAFGVVPLTTPYSDSEPEHRILNAVERGLLFERMKEPAKELEMSKVEYSRTLRCLKNDGVIYAGADGKYYLSFGTSNFPNLIAREDRI